jgi:hypothetical protein
LKYIGSLGYARACPQVIKEKSNKIVLAINRTELDKIRAGFLISGKDIKTKKVSGTLKGLVN